MKKMLDYFKESIGEEDWEEFREKNIKNIVAVAESFYKDPESVSNGDILSSYQKLIRLNDEAIEEYITRDTYNIYMEAMKKAIDSIHKDDIPLLLDYLSVQHAYSKAKRGIKALKNYRILDFIISPDKKINRDIMRLALGTDKLDNDSVPVVSDMKEYVGSYIVGYLNSELYQLLNKLDHYGSVLAYMQQNKIPGANKDDWELYWKGVELITGHIPSLVLSESLPAIISLMKEDMSDTDPILDHVVSSLFKPILENAYYVFKREDEIKEDIEKTIDNATNEEEISEALHRLSERFIEHLRGDDDDDDDEGEEWKKGKLD